jgi:hypothetical protein
MSVLAAVALTCLLSAAPASAATVSYFLDQSNALPDGTNYLMVTVSDDGQASPDTIFFRVEILDPLLSFAASNFGIQRFAFNSTIDPIDLVYKIGDLPAGWTVQVGTTISGFGVFELIPSGTGKNRVSPVLTFTIDSSSFPTDSISDYIRFAACPSGGAPDDPAPLTCIPAEGASYFAAHVAGFDYPGGIKSAYFGGVPESVVPIPAGVWLLGSSLVWLGWLRRRSQ